MTLLVNYKNIPTLQLVRVSAKTFDFEIQTETGEVVDLTASTGLLEVFLEKEGTNASPVISKALTITEAAKGLCTISLLDTETVVDTNVYKYRISFDYGSNVVNIYGDGIFDIIGDDNSRISEIKRTYGYAYEYYILEKALTWSRGQVLDNGFIKEEVDSQQSKSVFLLDTHLADSNFDEVLDVTDIDVQEFQSQTPYGINDLNANISSIVPNHPNGNIILTMDADYPSASGFTLRVTYYRIAEPYTKLKKNVKKLEELYVTLYLFSNLEPYKLQHGMTTKELNGVTITFDQAAIRDFQKKLNSDIALEIAKMKPWKNVSVQISKLYGRAQIGGAESHSSRYR